jgi:pSer/pThr/pTyr-binding forkhead associated (FHA) protein
LNDHRASRHHADIRWGGQYWAVVDRNSTNGTYVNGMQVHQLHNLYPGDRVTIGETTMVLHVPAASARAPQQPPSQRPVPRPATHEQSSPVAAVAFWLVAAVMAAAITCLAAGAFLPWVRLTGSLSQDLGPLIQGVTDIISSIFGEDSLFHVTQEVSGLEGYGKLTLGVAAVCAITLLVDVFYRKTVVPAIVYLLSGLIAVGAMASDLANFYGLYKKVESWSVMFGIQLGDVVEFFDQFIQMEVEPLLGLQLTVVGLVLLVVGGVGRLVVALLVRSRV